MTKGDLVQARSQHATLSIGPEQLPCLLSGENFDIEIVIKVIESRRLIDKQRSFDNDIIEHHNHHHRLISSQPCPDQCPPSPPTHGHFCVSPAGAQDCRYATDHCCCGICPENFTLSCANRDPTTGAGLWQSTLCPAEGCGSEGEW